MKPKLFSIFFALALLLSNVATQAQTSMHQHNLRQIHNVEVANKKSVVQGGNPIIAAKERIAQRQTQLRGNKAMQDYSLLNKVNETQLKARAMAAMAQQAETIEVDMGHCSMEKDGSNYSVWNFLIQKDNREYFAYVQPRFCGVGCQGVSNFTDGQWYDSNVQFGLTSYADGNLSPYSATTKVTLLDDESKIKFDIYYTCSDAVYHVIMVYDETFQYDYSDEDFIVSYNYTNDDYGIESRENGVIEIWADKSTTKRVGRQNVTIIKETALVFYTDNTSKDNIIPSGFYEINNSHDVGTIQCGLGFDNGLLGSYAGNIQNNNWNVPLYHLDQGFAIVVNPQKTTEPYIYLYATSAGGNVVECSFGTEPTKRTITVNWGNNGTEDGNNVLINNWEPVLAVNGNTFTFYQGSRFTFTPQPKDDYQFVSWAGTNTDDIIDNEDGTYSLTMGNKDYTVGAVFEPIPEPVDVTLSPNGGSGSDQVIRVTKGESMPTTLKAGGAIVVPTRAHYEFGGYYNTSASTGGTQYYSYSGSPKTLASARKYDLNTATILYARWIPETYSITYRDQNSDITFSGTQAGAPTQHSYGTATTLKIPTRAGYTFEGWYTAKDCASGAVGTTSAASLAAEAYTANITLYAKWSQKEYYLNLTTGGNGTVSRNDNGTSETALHYGDQITLSYSPSAGYAFTGWTGTGSSYVNGSNVFIVPDGATNTIYNVQANFALTRTITVSASPAAAGSVSGGGTYAEGANVTLTATANTGYKFSRWSDGNTSNPRNITVGNADAEYTAEFVEQIHDFEEHFTWENDVDAGNCGAKGQYSYKSGWTTYSAYIIRTRLYKNYVTLSSTSSYPAIQIDIAGGTGNSLGSTSYLQDYGSGKYQPYPGTCSVVVNSLTSNQKGKIISYTTAKDVSGNSGFETETKFYDSNGNKYRISSGTIKYMSVTSQSNWPFILVDGIFGGKTVWVTIGNAPSYSIKLNSKRNNTNATSAGTTSVTATYTENTNLTTPITIPTMTGYTFGGYWTTNGGTGTQVIDAEGNFIGGVSGYTDALKRWLKSETVTLYAKWTEKTYTVNLDNQEATTAGTESVTATYNAAMPFATMPTKAGYAFNGYYTSTNGGGTQYYTAAGASARNWNIDTNPSTLYAYWTQKSYTLAVSVAGTDAGASVTRSDGGGNATVKRYDDAITLTPVESTGYHFTGWTGTDAGDLVDNNNGTYTLTIADKDDNYPYAVTANFAANTNTNYTVKHWQQNLADNDYTEVTGDRQQLQGTTDDATEAVANTYTGFNAQSFDQETIAGDGSTVVNIYYNRDTYTVNLAVSPAGYGSVSPSAAITGVRYGTVITTGTGENANKVTINKTVVTANPAATTSEYTYTFDNWINGTATVTGSGLTVTANFTRTTNTYDITFKNADGSTLKKSDETTDAVYSVAYGETPVYDGATPTKDANSEYTYTFNGWDNEIVAVTTAATYTATYSTTKVQYTLTWDVNGGNELTGTYTNGTIDWGTAITKPADPTKSGYTFNGWDADNDDTADNVTATMPTNNVTYKALWTAASPNITLCENCDNDHYNTFKATYSGSAGVGVNVTYPRQFAANRWSTMCLPFSIELPEMITQKMYGRVYEFKYATGNANVGSGVNLYFSNATSIEAGKCYIVNADATLAAKTSFVFSRVTIDLSKDIVEALDSEDAYDDLPGYKSQGTIELVGTLRNGTLQGSAKDNTYMGLKNNMIYYPNTTYPGSTIWAYRGIFRSSKILDKESMQKMRIIVDGEDRGELIIDADGDILAPSDAQSRKFIENGVLYIERESVVYDAQGKRVEGM